MKQLIIVSMVLLASCSKPEKDLSQVKAKLEVTDIYPGNGMSKGDIVIRYIDSMYTVGESVRIATVEYKILAK